MFAYIKGELGYKSEDGIVVENNGIGYEINVPYSVMDVLPAPGGEVKIYTYLQVREDALKLFGFLSREDLEVFKLLITVNGIGPKAALGILSVITPDDLRFAILSDDVKAISRAPGIGAKTASKLILELKDKLSLEEAFEQKFAKAESGEESRTADRDVVNEAVQALTALGYSGTEALKAARKAAEAAGDVDVEELLKRSLKYIS